MSRAQDRQQNDSVFGSFLTKLRIESIEITSKNLQYT